MAPQGQVYPIAVGGAGTSIWNGQLDDWLDENSSTRGSRWYGQPGQIGEGQKMLSDTHVRRSRDVVVDSILAAFCDVEATSKDALDLEIADAVRYQFFERLSWPDFVGQACRGYLRDGFSHFEETSDIEVISKKRFPKHPGGGLGWMLTGLHYRPAWTMFGWGQRKVGDNTKLDYIEQQLPGSDGEKPGFVKIPASRLVRFTWEQEGANFEGFPVFRSAWGPWFAKRVLTRILLISHEKNHIELPFVEQKLGAGQELETAEDEFSKLAEALAQFRGHQNGYYFIPPGYGVDFKSGKASTDIEKTLDRMNFDIAHGVAAGFTLLGNSGSTSSGSFALADSLGRYSEISLEKHAHFLTYVLNNGVDGPGLVTKFVRNNYGPNVEVPKLIFRNMPTVDFAKVLPIINLGMQQGAITPTYETEVMERRVMKLPPITEEEYTKAADKRDAAKAVAQASPVGTNTEPQVKPDNRGTPSKGPY